MRKEYKSRGFLITEYVKIRDSDIEVKKFEKEETYVDELVNMSTRGFNLVFGNVFSGVFKYFRFENSCVKTMDKPIVLTKGIAYGMSNGALDAWDKVIRGRNMF